MPNFDRSKPWTGSSLAFVIFRKHFTEINDQYWGSLPTEVLAKKFLSTNDPSADLESALGVSGGNWHRVGHAVESFAIKHKLSREWARLSSLVLVTSCIEMFFDNITRAAQTSDPTLRPGFPKHIEGLTLLKHGARVQIESKKFTKGSWSGRISAYESHFGTPPSIFVESLGELDKMQRLRNRIAHQFGLETDEQPYSYLTGNTRAKLTQDRLQKWLGIADELTSAVDAHLTGSFIGDFETLELYYLWKRDKTQLLKSGGIQLPSHVLGDNSGFLKYLARVTKRHGPGKNYWRELDSYERNH